MGRRPKSPEQRQNASKKAIGTMPEGSIPHPPAPPAGLLPETRAKWKRLWASPWAWSVHLDLDLDAVERLFLLRDRFMRYYRDTADSATKKGSEGEVLHPKARELKSLAGEIRQLEERFGLNRASRLGMGLFMPGGAPDGHSGRAADEGDRDAAPARSDYDVPDDPRRLRIAH